MPRLCVVLLLLFGLCYCSETECVDEVKNNHQRSSALALNGFQIHEVYFHRKPNFVGSSLLEKRR